MKSAEESILAINEAYLLVLGREADKEGMHNALELVNRDENGLLNLYGMLLRSDEFSRLRVHDQQFYYEDGAHEEERLRFLVKAIYHFFLQRDFAYGGSESYIISEILDERMDIRSFMTRVIESEEYRSLSRLRAEDRASNERTQEQASALLEATVNSRNFDLIEMNCSHATISRMNVEFASFIIEFVQKRVAGIQSTTEYD